MLEDAEKRLNILFDRLNNHEISEAVIRELHNIAKGNTNRYILFQIALFYL